MRLPSGREVVVTASIGIACDEVGILAPEALLSQADIAMYRAKERGRARVEVFDDLMQAAMSRRLLIHEGLRRAVDTDELAIHYQPIVRASDRAIVGVEALARWHHHGLGQIPPSEFIPVAEDTGLMTELGSRIIINACEDLARWTSEQRCPPTLALNVNISARQLTDPGLVATIETTLAANRLEADRLWLEVTETVLMEDADHIAAALAELRAVGVHLAIDDFGTGYSSLAYLKRFPVEALKIDQSFVQELGSDPELRAIVAAHHRPGPIAAPPDHRGGHRDPGPARPAPGARLRPAPGLLPAPTEARPPHVPPQPPGARATGVPARSASDRSRERPVTLVWATALAAYRTS